MVLNVKAKRNTRKISKVAVQIRNGLGLKGKAWNVEVESWH